MSPANFFFIELCGTGSAQASYRAATMNSPQISAKLSLLTRLVIAAILLQTLFFKFTAAPESVAIFQQMGMEPWGRIGTGLVEALAAALLLLPNPRHHLPGAMLTLGVISGAVASHLLVLGIVVADDGGLLFGLALVVMIGSIWLLASNRLVLASWWRSLRSQPSTRNPT
jgi:putative oxidoreductase